MIRVTSELWVSAYLRRVEANGAFAALMNKGASAAGAIFIVLNHMNGEFSLFEPAPQMSFDVEEDQGERKFLSALERVDEARINEKLAREKSFDRDIWIVEIEDRESRHMLDLVEI